MRNFLLTACLLLSLLASAQRKKHNPAPVPDRFAGLDTAFDRVLKDWHAAGFAVAVVDRDSVIYAKGFGYRDVANKLPVTSNTLFAIGSCTKAFTASLIGMLQKDGKLSLDKPVRQYLPELRFYNDDMNDHILLRDLMCHRTGLPRYDYSWYGFPTDSRDSLMERIQYMQPNYGVREKWQYNNFMFMLQGMVAEKLTGKSWEENIREKIFAPVGMSHSNLSIEEMERSAEPSIGYDVRKDSIIHAMPYYHIKAMGPAGSINSNVMDMAQWLKTWIHEGKSGNKEIFPAAYATQAIGQQMVMADVLPTKDKPDIQFASYGFGWMLTSYKGHYRVEHGGNIDGFTASTCFFPTDSIGIVVLCNQNGSTVNSVVRNLLADRLLKLPYFDWESDLKATADKAKKAVKEAAKAKAENRVPNAPPTHPLKDYAGYFQHPAYGTFQVKYERDSVFVQLGKDLLWLFPYHYDFFEPFNKDPETGIDTSDKSPLRLQFEMNEGGEINGVKIALEPTMPAVTFKRITGPGKSLSKEALEKYTGVYTLSGVEVKVYVKEGKTLYVFVPGQPEYELVATGNDRFAFKILSGYHVQFDASADGAITGLTFQQPNGNFKAIRKK